MSSLTRTQKIILIIFAVLDVAVIGGLAVIVVSSLGQADSMPTAAMPTPTQTPPATWTPTPTITPRPTLMARPTNTPTPTRTPAPTPTATPTATPLPPIPVTLEGAGFDSLQPNRIPGWQWDAYINYKSGDTYSPETSYAEPLFTAADDPVRRINGTTLKVETIRWLKFRTWVHQTVTATAGTRITFRIKANAFSSIDSLIVKAGIDPTGAGNCYNARWGGEMRINQQSGTVTLSSPTVVVAQLESPEDEEGQTEARPLGRVTVCFFAEPAYPHINNAAFFDQAELIVSPPR